MFPRSGARAVIAQVSAWLLVLSLVALLAMSFMGAVGIGSGYRTMVSPGSRTSAMPIGQLYWDQVKFGPDAASGSYWAGDSVKIRRQGAYMPINRIDIYYDGAGTDSMTLGLNWASGQVSEDAMLIIGNNTTLVYQSLPIRCEYVRMQALSGASTTHWRIIGFGGR